MSLSPLATHPHLDQLRAQFAIQARRVQESLTSRVCQRICAVFLTFLAIAGVILFVLWLALRPHRPRFHLSSFSVPGLDPASPISFSVSDRNPNRNIGIYYDSMDGSVFYLDREVGSAAGLVNPFYQPPANTTVIRGATAGSVSGSGNGGEEGGPPDRVGGFRLQLKSFIRFKVTTWGDTHRHKLHVSCDVAVGPDGQMLPEYRERRCSIYFF